MQSKLLSITSILILFFVCLISNGYSQSGGSSVLNTPAQSASQQISQDANHATDDNIASDISDASAAAQSDKPDLTPPDTEESHDVDPRGPWMVCDIAAKGLMYLKERAVTRNVKAEKGQLYEREFINSDVHSLISTGNFENVSVDVAAIRGERALEGDHYRCHRITYIVSEKPFIDKIEFVGRKEVSKGKIKDAMSLKSGDAYDAYQIQDDMNKIKAFYKTQGFTNTEASFETKEGKKPNTVEITVNITEGPQSDVRTVTVYGLQEVPAKKLIKKTTNRPGKVYNKDNEERDIAMMTYFARNQGYYSFTVQAPGTIVSPDGDGVYITYWVKEGPKAYFGQVTFSGNEVIASTELAKRVMFKQGSRFRQDYMDETFASIREAYADKGYLKAMIRPTEKFNEATQTLDLHFDITENTVVYVDNIEVSGMQATVPKVITREVTLKPGDPLSSGKIRRSQQKIMNLGFINDVQPDLIPTADPDRVNLAFDIVEGKPGTLTAGAAVSSTDGLYGELSISHLNMFGRANRLSLKWSFGKKIMDYSLGWSTPWIFDKPITFGLDIFNTRRTRGYGGSSTAYKEKDIGGRVRLGPRFSDDKVQLNFVYTLEEVKIYEIESQFKNVISQGTSVTSQISAEIAYDTRDYAWDPTSGWRNSFTASISGGPLQGDVDIYRISLNSSYNHKLFEIGDYPIVWSVSNRFGFVRPYGDTNEVPVYNRYFLGGAETVRGYESTGEIGPENGGTVFYVFNSEIKFPIVRERRRNIIAGAIFFDMGNDWAHFSDMNLRVGSGINEMKMGAGFGIRFTTPAFPIRIDWGYGFNHKSGEDKTKLYFTIGNLF